MPEYITASSSSGVAPAAAKSVVVPTGWGGRIAAKSEKVCGAEPTGLGLNTPTQ